jgi:hypothetical protein
MIQCKDCEFYEEGEDGRRAFKCDPFKNVKEPECLAKWQLLRLDMLLAGFRGMTSFQARMAPMQDKIFKYVKRELEDIDESENWKVDDDDDDNDEDTYV